MASPTRTLTVNFVGRTSNLDKSFKRVAKGSSLMSDKLMKATRMAGIGFGALAGVTIGAAAALKPMIDKAADVEESVSKSRLVFGEASKAVEASRAAKLWKRRALSAASVKQWGWPKPIRPKWRPRWSALPVICRRSRTYAWRKP